MANADIKKIIVTRETTDPEGLYFNNDIILFVVAIGLGLFLLGLSIAYCIFCNYKKKKDAMIRQILSEDVNTYEMDKDGNIKKKSNVEPVEQFNFYGTDDKRDGDSVEQKMLGNGNLTNINNKIKPSNHQD